MLDLRVSPLGFAACLSKNVPFWRSVCHLIDEAVEARQQFLVGTALY